MTAKKDEVAVIKNGGVMVPDFMAGDMMAGAGFEHADKDSYAIPFLTIIQKMSPVCDEDDPAYIDGAKPGMIMNTVTQELFDGKEGIQIVPCAFRRSYLRWGGREGSEPGFKGEVAVDDIPKMIDSGAIVQFESLLLAPDENGKVHDKKSDRFSDTRAHYVLVILPDGSTSRAILSLSSTQIKASKALMMMLSQKKIDTPNGKMTPPTFANIVRLTTASQSNAKGSWSGAKFALEGLVTDPAIYHEAKDFYGQINDGSVAADYSKAPDATHAAQGEEAEAF